MKETRKKNNMRTSMQKPIIDAEAFMKFFEETTGAKFVDAETGQPALDILTKQKDEKKSDYDLWLEKQGKKTSP
jgi:hypothetical protein